MRLNTAISTQHQFWSQQARRGRKPTYPQDPELRCDATRELICQYRKLLDKIYQCGGVKITNAQNILRIEGINIMEQPRTRLKAYNRHTWYNERRKTQDTYYLTAYGQSNA